jgi:CRISPR-associated protein Cmr2
MLNYRYFTVRMEQNNKNLLKAQFEETWCSAKTNNGNIAPWMYHLDNEDNNPESKGYYETIWRDLVDLYPFIEVETKIDELTLS